MKNKIVLLFSVWLLSNGWFQDIQAQTAKVQYILKVNNVACSNFDLVKKHPEEVTSVEIELRNGTQLPKEIFEFTGLKKLIIRDLEGEFLTGNFSVFTQLEELEIEDCDDLLTLPESMGGMKALKSVLVLENFSLVNIPESFYDLPQLQTLSFSIASDRIPERIGNLTNLKELAIEFHKKKNDNNVYLPEEIIQLTKLKSVELSALGFPNKNAALTINNIVGSAQLRKFLQPILHH
ncbi:MAG: hypothetical protein FGM61_05240 [Sediminibacterium sp.]|nr:hypothetical protein [Sediminibacterium sp.]